MSAEKLGACFFISYFLTASILTILGSQFYKVKKYSDQCPKGCTDLNCYMYETWIDDYNHRRYSGYENSDGSTVTTCSNFTTYNEYSKKYITILIIGIVMLVLPILISFIIYLISKFFCKNKDIKVKTFSPIHNQEVTDFSIKTFYNDTETLSPIHNQEVITKSPIMI
jgi:Na+-transporting methylmalonyl-CoA/oxaloacetate decarboxylase gamma subunit